MLFLVGGGGGVPKRLSGVRAFKKRIVAYAWRLSNVDGMQKVS